MEQCTISIDNWLLIRSQRKFGLSADQTKLLLGHFAAGTPYSDIPQATGIPIDTINGIFAMPWQHPLHHVAPAPHRVRARRRLSFATAPPEPSAAPPRYLVESARDLLRLRLSQETVRIYLQIDPATWKDILRVLKSETKVPT